VAQSVASLQRQRAAHEQSVVAHAAAHALAYALAYVVAPEQRQRAAQSTAAYAVEPAQGVAS
jgi:hypothetical protein